MGHEHNGTRPVTEKDRATLPADFRPKQLHVPKADPMSPVTPAMLLSPDFYKDSIASSLATGMNYGEVSEIGDELYEIACDPKHNIGALDAPHKISKLLFIWSVMHCGKLPREEPVDGGVYKVGG